MLGRAARRQACAALAARADPLLDELLTAYANGELERLGARVGPALAADAGAYRDRRVVSAAGSTVVYEARFERDNVRIEVTLDDNEPPGVADLWFDSPLLRRSAPLVGPERDGMLARAEQVADDVVAGLNGRDYARATRAAGDGLRARLDEATFVRTTGQAVDKWGKCVARRPLTVEANVELATVTFDAAFERKPHVILRLVLERDGERLLSGLWLSPMRGSERHRTRKR